MYIQKTLLSKWSVYLEILANFPSLEILNFSDNVLSFDQDFDKMKFNMISEKKEFNLHNLVLNKSCLNINSLIKISFTLRKVTKLYLFNNYINEKMELNEESFNEKFYSNFDNIEFLSLEKNNIEDILKIYDILKLPKLKYLNLNQNRVTKLFNNNNREKSLELIDKLKSTLVGIYLDSNEISDFSFIDNLALIENLEDIYLLNNKFPGKNSLDIIKMHAIGKFLILKILNNTTLSKEVRKDYELMYLKHSVKEYFLLNPSLKEFDKIKFENYMNLFHKTYFLLKKKYFDPLEDILESNAEETKNTIKGNTVEVFLQYEGKTLKKKFPKSITFANLRNVISKLFKIDTHFNFFVLQELTERTVVLDEARPIEFYNISNGDTVEIK